MAPHDEVSYGMPEFVKVVFFGNANLLPGFITDNIVVEPGRFGHEA